MEKSRKNNRMANSHTDFGVTEKVSYFAEPQRKVLSELYKDIDEISISTFINELLSIAPDFLLILNSNLQIITANFSFLSYLGIENPADLLGLRVGEALNCNYSREMPAGCGTSKYCSTCGMAISLAAALDNNQGTETYCSIFSSKNGKNIEYFLSVKSSRIILNHKKYILVFLNDFTEHQKRAHLEKSFLGDFSYLTQTLNDGITNIINNPSELKSKFGKVQYIAKLMLKEIDFKKALFLPNKNDIIPDIQNLKINDIFDSLSKIFENNPVSSKIKFSIIYPKNDFVFESDAIIITKILLNALTNSFEHSNADGVVRLWTEIKEKELTFKIRNDYYIPEEISIRIFQKYFTTHNSIGRGLGTYFMKYFGENILGGKVYFTTSKTNETTFSFSLPINPNTVK